MFIQLPSVSFVDCLWFIFFLCFWGRVLLYSSSWSHTCHPPASVSWIGGLQCWATGLALLQWLKNISGYTDWAPSGQVSRTLPLCLADLRASLGMSLPGGRRWRSFLLGRMLTGLCGAASSHSKLKAVSQSQGPRLSFKARLGSLLVNKPLCPSC